MKTVESILEKNKLENFSTLIRQLLVDGFEHSGFGKLPTARLGMHLVSELGSLATLVTLLEDSDINDPEVRQNFNALTQTMTANAATVAAILFLIAESTGTLEQADYMNCLNISPFGDKKPS